MTTPIAAASITSLMWRRSLAVLAAVLAAGAFATGADAGPNLVVGVADNYLMTEPAAAAQAIRSVGFSAVRLTVRWQPGATSIGGAQLAGLQRAVAQGAGLRLVVVVTGAAADAPTTPDARTQFCGFARSVVAGVPRIGDVVIWNEPNTTWRPQFHPDGSSAAPAAYAALLEECYRVLHAARPGIDVVHGGLSSRGNDRPHARSNVSHSPGSFIREEGAATGGKVFFDTFGLHPYGETSAEVPWAAHPASSTIATGDYGKLRQALYDAFGATAPTPESGGGFSIWYLEDGWQTRVDPSKAALYHGTETDPDAIPALSAAAPVDQAGQLANAIRLAYCQPGVDAFFNFLLADDTDLHGWQSGLYWPDWTPKPSVAALQQVIRDVDAHRVDCSALPGGPVAAFQPKTGVTVERVAWPKARRFNWRNQLWRFRVKTGEPAAFTARLAPAGPHATTRRGARGSRARALTARGELRAFYFSIVKFPSRRLPPGRYAMRITLASGESSSRRTTLRSPPFTVLPRTR